MASLREQITAWGGFGSPLGLTSLRDATASSLPRASVPVLTDVVPLRGASAGYYAMKTRLHQKMINRIDLAAAEAMTPEQLRGQLREVVGQLIDEEEIPVNELERSALVTELQDDVLGLGPLEPLLADPGISEIMVNGYDTVYVERAGRLERSAVRFSDNAQLLRVIDKIVTRVGRRIDEASPMVDARLPDGSRINAVIAPVALDGPALSIRRFSPVPLRMPDLLAVQALSPAMAEVLAAFVQAKTNVLISGGTGSGKTTLLNILSSFIPLSERIITIEDTAELQLQQPHVVRLETRAANLEGRGEIPMRDLLKNSLRMRPDRIVLGEVRGAEVLDMLQAMNTGHEGSLTTIHANTPRDALGRLENLIGMGGVSLPIRVLRQQIASAIQVVVQTNRLSDGSRKVTSVHEVTGMEGDVITTQEIFTFERQGLEPDGHLRGRFRATGVRPALAERLQSLGVHLNEKLFDPHYMEA